MPRLNRRFCCRNGFGGKATRQRPRPDTPQLAPPSRAKAKRRQERRRISPQPSTAAVQEGLLRESARKGDAFDDVVMMALLRKEWPPAQKLDRPAASIATHKALP
jgi:hypothetical protein